MILSAVRQSATTDADRLRGKLAGPPSTFVPAKGQQKTWEDFRRLQVRQLFRLSLEALFHWTLGRRASRQLSASLGSCCGPHREIFGVARRELRLRPGRFDTVHPGERG